MNKQNCDHNWLKPHQDRTTCANCGRDGFVYVDQDPEFLIKELHEQIKILNEKFVPKETAISAGGKDEY